MRTLTHKIRQTMVGLLTAAALFFPAATLAVLPGREGAADAAGRAGLGGTDGGTNLYAIIGGVINTLLGLVGVIFLVLIIYAGFLWMTAGGNAEQITKAKSMLIRAAIGAIIVFSAYSFSVFIFDRILQATTAG